MKYLIYDGLENAINNISKLIDIPFFKCSHHCYLIILTAIQESLKDYPFEIGPYPSPLSWVSYMDSALQFSHIITSHITPLHYITYLVSG